MLIIALFSVSYNHTIITSSAWRNSEAEEHYTNLAAVTASVPKHNFIIVAGDCNAHIRVMLSTHSTITPKSEIAI